MQVPRANKLMTICADHIVRIQLQCSGSMVPCMREGDAEATEGRIIALGEKVSVQCAVSEDRKLSMTRFVLVHDSDLLHVHGQITATSRPMRDGQIVRYVGSGQ